MRRGTTIVHRFTTPVDLTGATVYVTYQQRGMNVLEKSGEDLVIEADHVDCPRTQSDTLAFHQSDALVSIQLRYVTESGSADASQIFKVPVEAILKLCDYIVSFQLRNHNRAKQRHNCHHERKHRQHLCLTLVYSVD